MLILKHKRDTSNLCKVCHCYKCGTKFIVDFDELSKCPECKSLFPVSESWRYYKKDGWYIKHLLRKYGK